jgi:hypothetical protein
VRLAQNQCLTSRGVRTAGMFQVSASPTTRSWKTLQSSSSARVTATIRLPAVTTANGPTLPRTNGCVTTGITLTTSILHDATGSSTHLDRMIRSSIRAVPTDGSIRTDPRYRNDSTACTKTMIAAAQSPPTRRHPSRSLEDSWPARAIAHAVYARSTLAGRVMTDNCHRLTVQHQTPRSSTRAIPLEVDAGTGAIHRTLEAALTARASSPPPTSADAPPGPAR